MEIQLQQHKKLKQQTVNIQNGLTVLVGTNGSGKSSFLEYLFINNEFETCVVYSSGVNESFSPKYRLHLQSQYRKSLKVVSSTTNEEILPNSKFYFSKEWAPFLLLAASFFATQHTNTFYWMNKFGLKLAHFDFELYFPSTFKTRLKNTYTNIERGIAGDRFETSELVKFINLILNDELRDLLEQSRINISWGEKESNLTPNPGASVLNQIIYNKLFDLQLFARSSSPKLAIKKFFKMLQILSNGGSRTKYIPLEKAEITFNRGNQLLTLNDLSDGEFQILLNSALLDLFDSENSLFLLDEIDAHIHPTKVKEVWRSFNNVSGYAFTTSHNLLTISNSEYNRIIFLEDGTIINDTSKKVKLVDEICGTLFGAPIWKSLLYTIENLVLIDGLGDWEVFKSLIQKQGIDFSPLDHELLAIERSSGTDKNSRDNLLIPKINFVKEMIDISKKSGVDRNQIKLKNIFLICDSDAYECPVNKLRDGLDIKKHNEFREFKVHSIIWNRRNIESYLISPTARLHYDNQSPASFVWGQLDAFGDLTEEVLEQQRVQRVKKVDCKQVVRNFIGATGFDKTRMVEFIGRMSNDEIDPYLQLVFNEIQRLKSSI